DEIGLKSPAQENFTEQTRCSVVGVNMGEDMITRRESLKNGHGHAGSRGERSRGGTTFQCTYTLLKGVTVRIVVAGVHESARITSFDVAFECGGKINR